MATPFRTQRQVEFHDTDLAGIMHFSAFFRLMESAEQELLRSLGLSIYAQVDGQTVSFPRVSVSCDYHSPAHWEDLLDIDVSVSRIGNKSVSYIYRFSHEGKPVATGRMTGACCVFEPGEPPRSTPVPAGFAEKIKVFAEPSGG